MIRTVTSSITPNEFFKLLLLLYIKRRFWLWLIMVLVAVVNLVSNYEPNYFIILLVILYPFMVAFRFFQYTRPKGNEIVYQSKYYEITENEIAGYLTDGSNSVIKVSAFTKAKKEGDYYLLYLTQTQHILLNKKYFQSADDLEWFEQNIFFKIKNHTV